MTATSGLATSSTASKPGNTPQLEILLALLPVLVVSILFTAVVTFLVMEIRKLKQRQHQFVRLQRLSRHDSHEGRLSFDDMWNLKVDSPDSETPTLPPLVCGRFYERFSQTPGLDTNHKAPLYG
jgi:hypothetical protein